jgi:hypothetical protein
MIEHIDRRTMRGQMNQPIAAANTRHELAEITRIGDNEIRPVRNWWARGWRSAINDHDRMALLDQIRGQRPAKLAAAASHRYSHHSLTFQLQDLRGHVSDAIIACGSAVLFFLSLFVFALRARKRTTKNGEVPCCRRRLPA